MATTNKKRHYFLMAVIMILIDIVIDIRFDMAKGWVLFIACFFGAIAGIYLYAAITTK